ncbi:MAG: tRNA-dihydrouridine synthase, partial [bacterium]
MVLKVNFAGIEFENPFLLSSAPPTNSGEMIARAFEAGWAGAVIKTVVPEGTRIENVTPRFWSLSFPGFEDEPKKIYAFHNIELTSDRNISFWLDEIKILRSEYPNKVVIASIMADGNEKDSWQELARSVEKAGAQMIELNFSCPHGGMPGKCVGKAIGQDPDISKRITSWVRDVARIPVIVKMTPNVTDITVIGNAVKLAGANGLTAINTVSSLAGVNIYTFEPLPTVAGYSAFSGYSGRGIKP